MTVDQVMARLGPMLNRIADLAERLDVPAPPPGASKAAPPEAPQGQIDDDDIEYIATALTGAQFDRIVAIRRGSADLAAWAALGAVPGKHVIVRHQIRARIDGQDRTVPAGTVLEISTIDPTHLADGRKRGLIVGPGEAAPAA